MDSFDYLVDCFGSVGRYRATCPLTRGDRVVVRQQDILYLAEVVRPVTDRHHKHYPELKGQLLRQATTEDLLVAQRMANRATVLLQRANHLAMSIGLPVELLDAEISLDGKSASLVYLHWQNCDIRQLVRPLSREFDLQLHLNDLTSPTAKRGCSDCSGGGCGSNGCGSGGCSTNGCALSVSREELQAYFAELRVKYQRRMPLL